MTRLVLGVSDASSGLRGATPDHAHVFWVSSLRAKQGTAAPERATQRRRGLRWLQQRRSKPALIFDRYTDDLRFLDRPTRCLVRGGDDEVRQRTTLDLSGAA